jgi:hypothetical protein
MEATSLKEMIQGMIPDNTGVLRGTVISESPLQIQITNDAKLILDQNILIIPRHLSDYTTTCDIKKDSGTIDSQTHTDGQHPHGASGGHAQYAGDGVHAHPGSEGAHINRLDTFNLYNAYIKVYNHLRQGENVFVLSFNEGKKYYVLDREVQ